MRAGLKVYYSLFRIRFINSLQYRTNPAAFPMDFSQMVSYILDDMRQCDILLPVFDYCRSLLFYLTTAGLSILTYGMRQFGQYPFSIYGQTVLRLLTFVVPLAMVQYYPLLYLLDRENSILCGFAPLVSLLFLVPSCVLYRLGLKKYQSTGS